MAADKKTPAADSPADARSEPVIRVFLNGFEQLTSAYGRSIQMRVADPGTRAIAEHFTRVLNLQASRLSTFVLQTYDQATPEKRSEVDQLLTRQAAAELASGTATLALNAASAPALKGIADIAEIIKKIIKFIVGLFGEIPTWLNDLLELIDEIIAALGGLFSFRLQRDINQTEVDYLKSMFHLRRLNMLEQSSAGLDDSDER